jgi:hypothetical protein
LIASTQVWAVLLGSFIGAAREVADSNPEAAATTAAKQRMTANATVRKDFIAP